MVQFEGPRHWNPSVSSILGKGNSCNFQFGWDWGVLVPGAFKLDHLQPFKPILFWKISNFFTFILGSQFYYPRGLIMGKGKFLQLPIWMRQRGFSAWGIQIGPFAALEANFVLKFFQLLTFILGSPFLLPQRANFGSWENFPSPNMDDTEGF